MRQQTAASGQPSAEVRTGFELVRAVQVRLVESAAEVRRWDATIRQHHYLGLKAMIGETLRYVAEVDGEWVALLGFASAALKGTPRDRFIGWIPEQQEARRIYIANNVRFLILPSYHIANLGSRVLGLTLRRLSDDWQAVHGHPVVLCETFVDPGHFNGGVYRAAGFSHIGETSGFAKSGSTWIEHNQPKMVWVRPLRRRAVELLCLPFLAPQLRGGPAIVDPNTLPLNGAHGLLAYMQTVADPRHRRGVRYPMASVLAVSSLAVICGMRSYRAIGQWAKELSQEQLHRLGCFRSPTTGKFSPPGEDTIRRSLTMVDGDALDKAVSAYLAAVLEQRGQRRLALDGKTLRGSGSQTSGQRHLLSAVRHGLGIVLGQVEVDGKQNEIPAAQRLLALLPLEDTVVTADALHTQDKTARLIVERGGEYLFTVKDNQPTLHRELAQLDWRFSPPVDDTRQGPRTGRETDDPDHPDAGLHSLPARRAGGTDPAGG